MKKIAIIIGMLCIVSCNSQYKEKQEIKKTQKEEFVIKPTEKWDVVKEYDDQGNLIRYDSIYTWHYSNKQGDSIKVNLDSIMDSFKRYFGEHTPYKWNKDFSYFPKIDSVFMDCFFEKDYFFINWQTQHSELEEMIKKLDSSRNLFMKKFHPELMESIEKRQYP